MSSEEYSAAASVQRQFASADASWRSQALDGVTVESSAIVVWVSRPLDAAELEAVADESLVAVQHFHLSNLHDLVVKDSASGEELSSQTLTR